MRCFLAFPETDEVEDIRQFTKDILQQIGAKIITIDEASYRSSYTGDVAEAIERADFVIGEVTDGNPNVLFQLGIGHGMRKRILALSRKGSQTPVDISGLRTIFYQQGNVEKLHYFLNDWLKESLSEEL